MSTKKLTIRQKKFRRVRKTQNSPEWPFVTKHLGNEMRSVIQFINKSNSNRIIEVLKKYLIITCVSLIDEVLTRLARRTIEEKNIRISAFKSQISKQFSQNQGTVGEIVVASFNLSKPDEIDSLFSCILRSDVRFRSLDMSFLRAVQKFEWYDPFREFRELKTKHLYKNWKDFNLDQWK